MAGHKQKLLIIPLLLAMQASAAKADGTCKDAVDYETLFDNAATACDGDQMKAEVGAITLKDFKTRYAQYQEKYRVNQTAWLQYNRLAKASAERGLCDDYNKLKKQATDFEIARECALYRWQYMQTMTRAQ